MLRNTPLDKTRKMTRIASGNELRALAIPWTVTTLNKNNVLLKIHIHMLIKKLNSVG